MTLTPASVRIDLKCGNGAISEGEKCTKGAAAPSSATSATQGLTHRQIKEQAFGTVNGKVLSNRQVRQAERGALRIAERTGEDPNFTKAQTAAFIATPGTQHRKAVDTIMPYMQGKALNEFINNHDKNDPQEVAWARAARRERLNRRANVATGVGLLGLGAVALAEPHFNRRRDSVWADGFNP